MFKVTDWGAIFCWRWRIKVGTIQAREHVPAIDCQNKAEHPQSNHYFAYRRPKKGAHRLHGWKKEGPESGPFFGAACGFSIGHGAQKRPPFFRKIIKLWSIRTGNWSLALEQFSAQPTRCREESSACELGWDGDPDASSSWKKVAAGPRHLQIPDSQEPRHTFLHGCSRNWPSKEFPRLDLTCQHWPSWWTCFPKEQFCLSIICLACS